MTKLYYPSLSLREGNWFKLICGASFQNLPAVRNLTLAYTLAGADCIDLAADPVVIAAAQEALKVATNLASVAQARGFGFRCRPWLMASLNDGEDPHFRKAGFDPDLCPRACPRPCENICPAQAIVFQNTADGFSGVIDSSCYGCGRCLPVCPSQLIYTRSYVSAPTAITGLIVKAGVDALEIHTKVGNLQDFQRLWKAIAPYVDQLKLIAISCPDSDGLIDYLQAIYKFIAPLPCPLVWQMDGRPMSGDIGKGATNAAVKLSQKVLKARLPGYVQLAGGTNNYTVSKLIAAGLLNHVGLENSHFKPSMHEQKLYIAGVAYGSYARVLLSPILEKLEPANGEALDTNRALSPNSVCRNLEEFPHLLWEAVASAHGLVSQLKLTKNLPPTIPE
ncbi:MAG: 4Fe-4S ferredoxin [Symploca sp. SIO3C6]|uniref:4Fe-4S ferredoxin n=1 Tax=Symploca sp. SIO1C4 TaxID=2607765 RepID=A0A6B3N6X0_9CYAN|nr:4Fe-4S ferredoxin [Symploca sp. SIO3C6]NER26362.1 4Fe-4S ferredoxin [Symploca sp. SIO1C4]NET05401.1 4Fe-4S ferredoxin [Symploca sp. SIO2B6]NET47659.1 4Fe-4S ferredoxin [Merismopedia sp. SIO2A8]